MALYNMCQKQVNVFSAQNLAMQEVKEKNSVDFQSHLTTKVPENTEAPQADLNHLTDDERSLLQPILREYSSLFRRHKFQVGRFPHFRAEAKMNETINCHQKRRPLFDPRSQPTTSPNMKKPVFLVQQSEEQMSYAPT
jgi:hypothetical protein